MGNVDVLQFVLILALILALSEEIPQNCKLQSNVLVILACMPNTQTAIMLVAFLAWSWMSLLAQVSTVNAHHLSTCSTARVLPWAFEGYLMHLS